MVLFVDGCLIFKNGYTDSLYDDFVILLKEKFPAFVLIKTSSPTSVKLT